MWLVRKVAKFHGMAREKKKLKKKRKREKNLRSLLYGARMGSSHEFRKVGGI